MLSPSFPPAICNTTRIVPSLPVTVWVSASAAIASSAKNVFSRKTGSVQVAAAPSMEVRRNCRRVCNVVFINSLGQLELRGTHHQMHKSTHRFIACVWLACFEILHKSARFFFRRASLKKSRAQKIDKVARLFSEFSRNDFVNVDWIAASLLGQLGRTTETEIGALAVLRSIRRRHGIAIDQVAREVVAK